MTRAIIVLLSITLLSFSVFAKDKKTESSIVMLWPSDANPTLRLTFERFNQLASYQGQLSLQSNVLVENLSGKLILEAGQAAKPAFQVFSVGIPATLNLVARNNSAGIPTSLRTVGVKVISVPTAAIFKVDGPEEGITPATVNLTVGSHILEFSKDGYATGSTPVDVKPDEATGGSITFELGGLSRDSVELRDGKVLSGDVISMSITEVTVRIDGKDSTIDRNQVKKIVLVERVASQQSPVTQSVPATSPK